MPTRIEWCHETWNPITGCSAISEGCKNCYARRMANRLRGRFGYPKNEPFKVTLHPDKMDQPERWRKPRMIFVCSMGDLFHEKVQHDWIRKVLVETIAVPQHTYLLLTKRPERMKHIMIGHEDVLQKNIWLGVTAENQKRADERIPILLQIPAAVRFVSIEPMLESMDIRKYLPEPPEEIPFRLDSDVLQWVIAGPETGSSKRECKPEWIRDLYEQCQEAGVPFFDKTKTNWIAREFPNNE